MRAGLLIGAALIAAPIAAHATPGSMTVADFLTKADKLKSMGMRAMFSPDVKPLMAEMSGTAKAYRAEAAAARGAGRTDLGCPPAQGKLGVNSNQILAEFAAIAPAERARTTTRSAFYAMMKRKFPCS